MELEDDWADIRPMLPDLPAKPVLLRPDHLQKEAVTPAGLIVPRGLNLPANMRLVSSPLIPAGTVYAVSAPEHVGRMPIRSEIAIEAADRAIGWTVSEMTSVDIDARDSEVNLHRLQVDRERGPHPDYEGDYPWTPPEDQMVWTSLPVLEELWGRSWNAGAANFIQSLRPSGVRIIRHMEGQTANTSLWRVTVQLAEGNTHIERIIQEVEVAGVGFRNGQDARNFYDNNQEPLMQNQSSVYINPRGISRLQLHTDDPPPDVRSVAGFRRELHEPRIRELHEMLGDTERRQQEAQFDRAEAAAAQASQELGPDASEKTILDRAGELFEAAEMAAIRLLHRLD